MLGLVVAVTVGIAVVAVACYGCFTIVLTVLTVARPRQVDPVAEELDSFLTDLLGSRDPALDPDRSGPTPGRRRVG